MNFRRSSSSSFSQDESGKARQSASPGGKPLSRWLTKTNALLEQITNAPGARSGEWEEEEARAGEEAERVRCLKCGVVMADKGMLKQHYILFPRHNPGWTGEALQFPASPPTPASPENSRKKSAASVGFDHHFHNEDDDDGPGDHGLGDIEATPLTQTEADRTRFSSQFSQMHPSFYERDVSFKYIADNPAGALGTKVIIGPGHGMTYNPNTQRQGQSHARTSSLSAHTNSQSTTTAAPVHGRGMHGRSQSVGVISTSHTLIGFEDDFVQGTVTRAPIQRSATEPAIHFDSIEEHDDEEHDHAYDDEEEEEEDDDDEYGHARDYHRSESAPSTPPLDRPRRDSIESDDTYLATPAQLISGRLPEEDEDEHLPITAADDGAGELAALSLHPTAAVHGSTASPFDAAFNEADSTQSNIISKQNPTFLGSSPTSYYFPVAAYSIAFSVA
ncbi:unnamed protein product [Tilletia controversa]|nr:unnamed protein product [Tilletia controversa]